MNKYHYAFHYFKKPIEIKMFHSPNLKKAYDVKKESKPDTPTKPRKIKVRCAFKVYLLYTVFQLDLIIGKSTDCCGWSNYGIP